MAKKKKKPSMKCIESWERERERERDQITYVHTPKMISYFLKSSKFLNASELLIT